MIKVSAPGKIHLLGEHAVVYGKPALLTTVDLRVTTTVIPSGTRNLKIKKYESRDSSPPKAVKSDTLRKVIEPIIKNHLKTKNIPPYLIRIDSQIPIGSGLGSSAAVSASYIAALLSFLQVKWDLNLIFNLTYEAERAFHGNPSGGDPTTVVFGGLIWFRKETEDLKIIHPIPFSIPKRLAKNFVIINTGTPKESTKDMVSAVRKLYDTNPKLVNRFLENQENLVRQLLSAIKDANENEMIRIIRAGEANLESIGVVSKYASSIIRIIEQGGGAAKICGGGGKSKEVGVLLIYHPNKTKLLKMVNSFNLPYFITKLGVEGLRQES